MEVQKNPDYKMWKKQISSGIGKDPDKPNIFIKKTLETIRTPSFIRFLRRSGLTEVYYKALHLVLIHKTELNLDK